VTSFGISQIVNQDCFSRVEDYFVADFDTETKDSWTEDCGAWFVGSIGTIEGDSRWNGGEGINWND
jgi:hypothetical protein